MNKHLIVALTVIPAFAVCVWTFNHINSWVGIIAGVAALIAYGKYLINQINKA